MITIKKLRELILTLAMQGKLVPQDPSDEPASELLRSIEIEKKQLVKDGKIKQPKPLSEVELEEVPYDLPDRWEWVRIRNICHDWGQKIPDQLFTYIDVGSIDNTKGMICDDVQILESSEAPSRARKIVRQGTVIYSTVRPYLLNIAIIEQEYIHEPIASTAFAIVHPYNGIINRFVYYYLKSPVFIRFVESTMKGVAYPAINDGDFFRAVFPLPPLAEQRRIVAKIDQLMARCDELEKLRLDRSQWLLTVHTAAIDRLLTAKDSSEFRTAWNFLTQYFGELYSAKENVAELRKTILQLAVMGKLAPQDPNDEPVDRLLTRILTEQKQLKSGKLKESQIQPLEYNIPSHWKWQCLDSILVYGPTNGFSPQAVDYETPVRSLTLSATTSGKFKGEHSKFIANEIPPDSNLWLRDGDILVQRGNTLEYVGVSAVYRGEPNCFIYPDLMMKLRVSSEIDTNFIYLVMSSEPCRNFLRSRASGTSGTMPKINQTTLKSLPIPLPPLAEQRRIVEKIDRLMGLCDQLEESIKSAKDKQIQLLNTLISQV
jgi:type I restriction enzyme, S subunit